MGDLKSRLLLIVLTAALVWMFLIYSHTLVTRLESMNRNANETIAWFWAGTQIPFSLVLSDNTQAVCSQCGQTRTYYGSARRFEDFCSFCRERTRWIAVERWTDEEREQVLELTRGLFRRLVSRVEYATVLTDDNGTPQIVNGDPVPDSIPSDRLTGYRELTRKLDEMNDPIPLVGMAGDTIGWLHYGSGRLSDELRIVPMIELAMLLALAGVLFFGVKSELRREKEMAWVGFARETAHQLGTPISSLLGWLELLGQRPEAASDPEMREALLFMAADVDRLNSIASRYGEMGKKPRLSTGDVDEVISRTVEYFRNRPGLLGRGVRIETSLEAEHRVKLSPVLLGWVFENLIKNSLAALSEKDGGVISVSTRDLPDSGGVVEVLVADDGRGVPFRDQGRIFNAGFTTRRGGWGLGLTLSRRIVEEYHGGRIRLVASSPGKGTSFSIQLPAASAEDEDDEQGDGSLGR